MSLYQQYFACYKDNVLFLYLQFLYNNVPLPVNTFLRDKFKMLIVNLYIIAQTKSYFVNFFFLNHENIHIHIKYYFYNISLYSLKHIDLQRKMQ